MISVVLALQTINAAPPSIQPAKPEMAFVCARVGKPHKSMLIGLPNGLDKSDVLLSDPNRFLGRSTFSSPRWQIGADGHLTIVFRSSGNPYSPVLTLRTITGKPDVYFGKSHPANLPNRITAYSCELLRDDRATLAISSIKAKAS